MEAASIQDRMTSSPEASVCILLVEDDPDSCRGHRVMAVASGDEAVEMLKRLSFELVITDRAMQDMNGDHMAMAVKEACPDTRVILLTGFGEMMDLQGEKPEGVDLILPKPATQKQIWGAVARVITSRNQ